MSRGTVAFEAEHRTEITCAACGKWGIVWDQDERGFLVAHQGRRFPCRVPLAPPDEAVELALALNIGP